MNVVQIISEGIHKMEVNSFKYLKGPSGGRMSMGSKLPMDKIFQRQNDLLLLGKGTHDCLYEPQTEA